ncbi:hypothetical protein SLEP1_g12171, partial [Rubroshorea leprosula]
NHQKLLPQEESRRALHSLHRPSLSVLVFTLPSTPSPTLCSSSHGGFTYTFKILHLNSLSH